MLDAPHTPALAVLRFAKLRTMGKLAVASQHNTRTADSGLSHTTPPPDGPGVIMLEGHTDAAAAWHERAAAVGLGKPRRDAVLAVEMVMSARGRPKRETKAQHKSAAAYRAEAAQDRAEAAKVLAAARVIEADTTRRDKQSQRTARDAQAGADAFTKGLDAVEQGELVAAPKMPSGLAVQPVAQPILPPQMTREFGGWYSNVRPYLKALVGYAKRLAGLAEREEALKQREAEVARQAATLERVAHREAMRESARAAPDAPRPARDDYHAVAAIVARSEFADPPGNPSPRERPRGRDRADER